MSNDFNSGLDTLLSKMESFVSSKTVVGQPTNIDGIILVPLVDIIVGVGAGANGNSGSEKTEDKSGSNKDNASVGGGLGAKITPSAMLVIANGDVKLVNVKNQDSLNKLIDMVPDVLNRFNLGEKKDNKSDKEDYDI